MEAGPRQRADPPLRRHGFIGSFGSMRLIHPKTAVSISPPRESTVRNCATAVAPAAPDNPVAVFQRRPGGRIPNWGIRVRIKSAWLLTACLLAAASAPAVAALWPLASVEDEKAESLCLLWIPREDSFDAAPLAELLKENPDLR